MVSLSMMGLPSRPAMEMKLSMVELFLLFYSYRRSSNSFSNILNTCCMSLAFYYWLFRAEKDASEFTAESAEERRLEALARSD